MATPRSYRSPVRARHAEANRQRMLDATRELMLSRGFTETTIDDIAAAAELAPQTVRAVFGTKAKLLAATLERAAYNVSYADLVRAAQAASTPAEHLALAAAITRHIHHAMAAELSLLRGVGALAPELAELDRRLSARRRTRQTPLIEHLVTNNALRAGLDPAAATDIVWALTGPELFGLLVTEQGWGPERYQAWLTEQLTTSLLDPSPGPDPAGATDPTARPYRSPTQETP